MKSRRSFSVVVPATAARAACAKAITTLGWELAEAENEPHRMTAHEDPAMLCCVASPVTIEVSVRERGDATEIAVKYSVSGFGPVASNALRGRRAAFEEALGRALGTVSRQTQ